MPVVLYMRPREVPVTWERFRADAPPFSIALDGYVAAAPCFDPDGPRLNLNHHEGCDRLATRATCGQTLLAIRQGLFTCFRDDDGPLAHVFCNDCDEDVCTSWFLLRHGHLAEHTMNPALNRLVALEDMLDATAGAYPFPHDLPVLRELAWVFEPYRRIRLGGQLDRKEAGVYEGVVADVEGRIMRHITGRGEALPLDTRYERLGGGSEWLMVREAGAQARTGLFADGVFAYVAVRDRPDGRWAYTVGRMSPFIPFDVAAILAALNERERCAEDSWGGGNTIGGSPRVTGSALPPDEVARVVNSVLASQRGTATPT